MSPPGRWMLRQSGRAGPFGMCILVGVTAACGPGDRSPDEATANQHPAIADPLTVDPQYPPTMRELSFRSGGSKLNGLLYLADGRGPHPTVILLHGYAGNERNLDLAQAMRRSGSNVLYFNYRGSWGSGGEFSFGHALEDVGVALAFVRHPETAAEFRIDPTRVALVGHSFGGFLAAISAADDAQVACLGFIAGADFGPWGRQAEAAPQVRAGLVAALGADMDYEGGPIRAMADPVVQEMIDRADEFSVVDRAPALAGRPIFIVGGDRDESLPRADHHDRVVAALQAAGAERLTEIVYDDDHSFSAHRVDLARRITDWLRSSCWGSAPVTSAAPGGGSRGAAGDPEREESAG